MKQIVNYFPKTDTDNSVTITTTTADTNFKTDNLKSIKPSKVWKSTDIKETIVKYDFGVDVTYNAMFLNRFNFAKFYVETSTDDSTWTLVEEVSNLTTDEISDENYMHRFVDITGTYRYIRVRIPEQTPLFEPTYFKIGNMLVGDAITIWNPRSGFSVTQIPKLALLEFKSGHISVEKVGKTRRSFSGSFDKVKKEEFDKIIKTYNPFVIYQEFDNDKTSCYLVRVTKEFVKDYYQANTFNMSFSFEEIV